MADLGDLGKIVGTTIKSEQIADIVVGVPIKAYHKTISSAFPIIITPTSFKFEKLSGAIVIPWYVGLGTNYKQFRCSLSTTAISINPTEKPQIFINNSLIAEGTITSGSQDIDVYYNSSVAVATVYVTLAYYSTFKYSADCTWYVDNTDGIVEPINTLTTNTGNVNCPYPLGEEKPIDYGLIELTGSATNELTFTIPADTVASTVTDAQILLTLSTYGSNVNGTIEDIFDEIGSSWSKLYAYDGLTSLKIDVETWNESDEFAKIWITIPSLTTAAKDIDLNFDILNATNPDSTIFTVIGF